MAVFLFISCAQRDDGFCGELLTFLQPMIRDGRLVCWHRGMLPGGDDVRLERAKHLRTAQIILCLLSADYFGTSMEEELSLIKQERDRGAILLPVLVRQTPPSPPFVGLQLLPRNGKPISTSQFAEEAWPEVATSIRERLQMEGDDLAVALQKYRSYRVRTYGIYSLDVHLEPLDAPDAPATLSRYELFVQPAVKRTPPPKDSSWWPDGGAGALPIQDALQQVPWVLLMGIPGAGKTEFVLWLMATVGTQEDPATALVPVYVDLRSFAAARQGHIGEGYDFFTYIDHMHKEVSLDLRKQHLGLLAKTGRLLWLFDGLDEVAKQERQAIGSMIAGLAAGGGRGIVTCRLVEARQVWGTLEPVGFEAYTLLPFDTDRIKQLITHFYKTATLDSQQAPRMEQRLWQSLTAIPALRELCRPPLLLILVLLYNQHEDLPRRRHKIYQKAVVRMADRWNAPARFELDDKLACLRELAWWMQVELPGGDGNLVSREALLEWATRFCVGRYGRDRDIAQQWAQELLDGLRRRSGILVQFSKDSFGFFHKSFLEYLAAEAAVRKFVGVPLLELYVQRWQNNEGWREILAILSGLLDERELPDQIVRALQELLHKVPFADRHAHIAFVAFAIHCAAEVGPVHREPMHSFITLLGQLTQHAVKALLLTPEIPLDSEVISWGETAVMPLTRAMQVFGSRWANTASWQSWALAEGWHVAPHGMREQVYLCALAAVGGEQQGELVTAILDKEGCSLAMLALLKKIKSIEFFQDRNLALIKQVLAKRAQGRWCEVLVILCFLKKHIPEWSITPEELGIAGQIDGLGVAAMKLAKSGSDEKVLTKNFQNLLEKMLPSEKAQELVTLLGPSLLKVGAALERISQTQIIDAEAFQVFLDLAGRLATARAPNLRKLAWAALESFAEGDPDVLRKIEEMLQDGVNENARLRAAFSLGLLGKFTGRAALWQLARTSAHEQVRLDAAVLLIMNPDPLDSLALAQLLLELAREGHEDQTRAQAIYTLAFCFNQNQGVQDALVQWAETDGSEEVRLAAALMLKRWTPVQAETGRRVSAELSRGARDEAVLDLPRFSGHRPSQQVGGDDAQKSPKAIHRRV